eukprot:COSAG03_NODE_673_length_6364_cov_4.619314_2_plen_387_part_00
MVASRGHANSLSSVAVTALASGLFACTAPAVLAGDLSQGLQPALSPTASTASRKLSSHAGPIGPRLAQANVQHRFVPSLQVPAGPPLGPGADFVNVTQDLGANNPSAQFDGTNWHFHFERGDAGWISAFELANQYSIHRIYFPRGTYWFGSNSTTVDLSLYPRLWDGTALDVFGDGDYLVHFLSWAPIVGPMLDLSSSKTFASMSWKIHGLRFEGCATEYAFSINLDRPGVENQPRAEHNNFKLYDVSFGNYLENNTCHEKYFPPVSPSAPTYAKGAVYLAHMWSSQIEMGLATVSSSAPYSLFNQTGGVILNEVQYSTLSLRGTGTHSGDTWVHGVQPWHREAYNGWGVILKGNVNSNTIIQTHCEGSGGCVLIEGPGAHSTTYC